MFLWNVHRDPQTWPEPEVFKTERFLDDAGKVVKKEELIPFGVGRFTELSFVHMKNTYNGQDNQISILLLDMI